MSSSNKKDTKHAYFVTSNAICSSYGVCKWYAGMDSSCEKVGKTWRTSIIPWMVSTLHGRILRLGTCLIQSCICARIALAILWGYDKDVLSYYPMFTAWKCTDKNSTEYSWYRTLRPISWYPSHGIHRSNLPLPETPSACPRSPFFIPISIDYKYQAFSSLHCILKSCILLLRQTYRYPSCLVRCLDTLMYPVAIACFLRHIPLRSTAFRNTKLSHAYDTSYQQKRFNVDINMSAYFYPNRDRVVSEKHSLVM